MTDLTSTIQTDTAARSTTWADTGNPNQQANEARDALGGANAGQEPRVMLFGNAFVRLTERGGFNGLTRSSMIDELAAVTQFRVRAEDGKPKNVPPPQTVAQILLDRDTKDLDGIPRVKSLTDVPIFVPGEDGRPRLISTRGLDRESGIYYLPAPGLEDMVLDDSELLTSDVEEAIEILREDLLGDFDIDDDDDASWANVMAFTILPFVCELIPGSTLCSSRSPPTWVRVRPNSSRRPSPPAAARYPRSREPPTATRCGSGSPPLCSPVAR